MPREHERIMPMKTASKSRSNPKVLRFPSTLEQPEHPTTVGIVQGYDTQVSPETVKGQGSTTHHSETSANRLWK